MTDAAPYFKPPHAVTIWSDDVAIYVEIPSKSGSPYIERFAHTEGGLSKAMNILRTRRREAPASFSSYDEYKKQESVVTKSSGFSEAQRLAARAVLKARGII